MKTLTSQQRRVLADNDIPVSLKELFTSLAGVMTRDSFQVEINRRVGALFRVAGIDLQLIPYDPDNSVSDRATPLQQRLPLRFIDGSYDLVFSFGLAQLSERSKQSVYDATTTILTDFLKVVTLSGPAALHRFRSQARERRAQRFVPETASSSPNATDETVAPDVANVASSVPYEPAHNPTKFAHRLRNLLAAIMSASSQLASENRSNLDEDDLLLIKTIENASAMEAELVRRYLMAYGPLRLSLKPLDLGAAVRSAVEWHDSQFGCETDITSEGSQIETVSDAALLRQIVVEVLRNAHEAANGEPVTLRWSVSEKQALIMIKNRGEINGTDFETVFSEPFYTTKGSRSGLGLAIARRYAGHLGGTVKGLSLHGHTVVTICLPLTQTENDYL